MVFGDEADFTPAPKLLVIGVGGAGCNFIDRMINYDIRGVEFVAVNTDAQTLKKSKADTRIQIGRELTRGYGAGTDPNVGRAAAEESYEELTEVINGADMVFIATGMGGGTGTGSAPVIAKICRECGILTVAIATKPFKSEGSQRMQVAGVGLEELKHYVDTLIIVPNQNIYKMIDPSTTLLEAYREIDDVIRQAVQSVADTINVKGLINVDLADIKKFMTNKGTALMGIGVASGPDRAIQATRNALHSKLLEVSIDGATDAIVNITASADITAMEIEQVLSEVRNNCSTDINIKPGQTISKIAGDELIVTIIATGYELKAKEHGILDISKEVIYKQDAEQINFMINNTPTVDNIVEAKKEEENSGDIDHLFKKKKTHIGLFKRRQKDTDLENSKEDSKESKEQEKKKTDYPSWLS